MDIAVARVPATDARQRIGSLFFNFGGPGAPAVDYLQAEGAGHLRGAQRAFRHRRLRPARGGAEHPGDRLPGRQGDRGTAGPAGPRRRRSPWTPMRSCPRPELRRHLSGEQRRDPRSTSRRRTSPGTWMRCAPRSATSGSATSGSPTGRSSGPPMRHSSPTVTGLWCSTARWIPGLDPRPRLAQLHPARRLRGRARPVPRRLRSRPDRLLRVRRQRSLHRLRRAARRRRPRRRSPRPGTRRTPGR